MHWLGEIGTALAILVCAPDICCGFVSNLHCHPVLNSEQSESVGIQSHTIVLLVPQAQELSQVSCCFKT
jgi:hypothetical protein